MDYLNQIKEYIPTNEQEKQDKKVILDYIYKFSNNILLRDNEFAHISSSGFTMNKQLNKVLMVKHHIIGNWAWTGGHADGDSDFLKVAIKEAKEETGIQTVTALSNKIISVDILPVGGHYRRGKYVSAHQHLSIAYILIANEDEKLKVKEDENSGVKWMPIDYFTSDNFSDGDVYLYNKLISKSKIIKRFS